MVAFRFKKGIGLQPLKRKMRLVLKSCSFVVLVTVFLLWNIFYNDSVTTTSGIDVNVNHRNLGEGEGCSPVANPKWLAIFYTIGILWLFLGLAIVADEYFVPALDVIAEEWELSPDVAGATLLAAGGSAPELFTNLSAVIQNKSSTGFGAIVGSAVFNLFFVVGVCAIVCPTPMVLTWWPISRDSMYYAWVLIWLAIFFRDYNIVWWEALILHLFYWLYILIMAYNVQLQAFFTSILFKSGTALLESKKRSEGVVKSSDIREGFFQLLTKNKSMYETAGISIITKLNLTCSEAFAKVDTDGNGTIDINELKALFAELGITNPDEAAVKCMKEVDINSDGKMDEAEFGKWYISSKERLYSEIVSIFSKTDVDGDGELSGPELIVLVNALGIGKIDAEKAVADIMKSSLNMSSITLDVLIKWFENSSEFMNEFCKQATILEESAEGIRILPPEEKTFSTMFWYIVTLPQILCFWLTIIDTRMPGRTKWRSSSSLLLHHYDYHYLLLDTILLLFACYGLG